MSIATDLTQVATNLNTALTTANAKITAKGGTASSTIYGLSTAIEDLPSGSSSKILTVKTAPRIAINDYVLKERQFFEAEERTLANYQVVEYIESTGTQYIDISSY